MRTICDDDRPDAGFSLTAPVLTEARVNGAGAAAQPTGDRPATHLILGPGARTMPFVVRLTAVRIACEATDGPHSLEPIGTCGLGGWRARWGDGSERAFGGVVLVSPPAQLPWLDRGLFDWEAGHPALVAGLLAPGLANLYLVGLGASATGAARPELLVAMIRAQAGLGHPLVDELMRVVAPHHNTPAGRAARRLDRRMQRRLRSLA